jgi:SEC-C motif
VINPTERITTAVEGIRSLIACKATSSVVGWCIFSYLKGANDLQSRSILHSPGRQFSFLLGLMLTTPEPASEDELTEDEWSRVQNLLNEAFDAYQFLYYPASGELANPNKEWERVRKVALPTFMHYVGSGIIASVEQVDARITRYLSPFDVELAALLGITASAALDICRWLSSRLQESLTDLNIALDAEKDGRLALLSRADKEEWSLTKLQEAVQTSDYAPRAVEMLKRLNDLGCVYLKDLREVFPDTADAFWRHFTVARGSGTSLSYPTERTDYDVHPLILRDSDSAFCPSVNALFIAILLSGEQALTTSSSATRYYKWRDRSLESEGEELFRRYFGTNAEIRVGLFERPDCQFEHDIIILVADRCLVVEAKAAPPVEPFRDPDKAFTRLRHAFRADTGIQSAFIQASRIVRRLRNGETVDLFDGEGNLTLRLNPAKFRGVYAICLTRDDHGPLATNLNLLLEKEMTDSYPWVVNTFDFAALCEAREYWNLPPATLFDYLDERLPLHGKAFTIDELDLFAFRLRHGTLNWIRDTEGDLFIVDAHYADLFDEMYHARTAGDPKVALPTPTQPILTDLRQSLRTGRLVTVPPKSQTKYPRNRPCPCGSGKKFKRCCGAAGRVR